MDVLSIVWWRVRPGFNQSMANMNASSNQSFAARGMRTGQRCGAGDGRQPEPMGHRGTGASQPCLTH